MIRSKMGVDQCYTTKEIGVYDVYVKIQGLEFRLKDDSQVEIIRGGTLMCRRQPTNLILCIKLGYQKKLHGAKTSSNVIFYKLFLHIIYVTKCISLLVCISYVMFTLYE